MDKIVYGPNSLSSQRPRCFDNVILHLNQINKIKSVVVMRNHPGTFSPPFIQRRTFSVRAREKTMETVDWRPRKLRFQPERKENIRGRVLVVTAVNDLLIQTNRTALQTCKAEEWTLVCPPCNFRRNHSNCSVIELCRTQSEAKHLREKLIKFDFRTQSNLLDLIERFKPILKIDKDLGCSKQKGTIRTSSEGISWRLLADYSPNKDW